MLIKSTKGIYDVIAIFKDAFILEKFEEAYIEELFDKYPYIVGDLSDGLLRLKGFGLDPKKPNYYKNIKSYIEKSCVFEAPYYILKRIKNYNENYEEKESNIVEVPEHYQITKENFDRESLTLESSGKNQPNIVLDLNRINDVPMGKLPQDLKSNEEEKEENVTTVVASEGFVPQKRPYRKNNNHRNNKKEYHK